VYARVARWEGVDPERMKEMTEQIEGSDGPPPGVPAKGIIVLNDADAGRNLTIVLFDSEEDMRKGDETLNSMDPGGDGAGSRTSVEVYEMAIDRRL
jgi:hypothetical protein